METVHEVWDHGVYRGCSPTKGSPWPHVRNKYAEELGNAEGRLHRKLGAEVVKEGFLEGMMAESSEISME